MILEGIVTTENQDGTVNVSPMGPLLEGDGPAIQRFTLRPYQTSRTYQNLKRHGTGVLHVTDDVLLLARSAVNLMEVPPETIEEDGVRGRRLIDCCRWYAFRVSHLDDSQERTTISCDVYKTGQVREFFGFNRAKHAVLEAAILATRVEFLAAEEILGQFEHLKVIVQKTAGVQETEAFQLLDEYVRKNCT